MEFQWLTGFSAGMVVIFFRRLNQCESAGDGLALNRLALARNGCGFTGLIMSATDRQTDGVTRIFFAFYRAFMQYVARQLFPVDSLDRRPCAGSV